LIESSVAAGEIQQVTIEQLSALYTFLFPTFWRADVARDAVGGVWQQLGNFLSSLSSGGANIGAGLGDPRVTPPL